MTAPTPYDRGAVRRRASLAVAGVLAVVMALLATPAASADPDDPITMPDVNLRACVNEALGPDRDADDAVTEGEALSLDELFCGDFLEPGTEDHLRIVSLAGIEYFTNLKEVNLASNSIQVLSPLEDLANLEVLFLNDNQLGSGDLAPLQSLTNLERLVLNANNVSDLTEVAAISSLKRLSATSNDISDLAPLSGLELTELSLSFNDIEDVGPLADLSELTNLSLRDNRISNVEPLAGLTNLTNLNLTLNRIVDISPLGALPVNPFATGQQHDLGDVVIGVPQANPVIGLDGSPIALDGLYDSSGNTFTPTEAGPTEVGWESGEPEPRFFGTLAFNPVAGEGPPNGGPGDDDPGDTDPPGQSEPPSTPTPEPPAVPGDPTDTDPPGEADPETVEPNQPALVDPPTDVGAEVGAEGAETAGSRTLPVTGGRQGVLAFVALTLVAVGAMASSFGRPFRNQNSSASRS